MRREKRRWLPWPVGRPLWPALVVLAALAGMGFLAHRYLPQPLSNRDSVAQAVPDWQRCEDELGQVPRFLFASILLQAAAFDARRDEVEAQGRRLNLVFRSRKERPILVDLEAWRRSLEPIAARLRSLIASHPLARYGIWAPESKDLSRLVNVGERFINRDLVHDHLEPAQLRFQSVREFAVVDISIQRRFADGSVGVVTTIWRGDREPNQKPSDSWQTWKVILVREAGRWHIRGAQLQETWGDGDAAYGPRTRRDPVSEGIAHQAGAPQIF